MASSGLLWFDKPDRIAQQLSIAADEVSTNVYDIVHSATFDAAEEMRKIIRSGGINQTQKGGPRIDSGAMIGSVDAQTFINGRARVQGEMGFTNGAPEYTKFQEDGTRHIAAMLAFATAQKNLVEDLQSQFEQGKWMPNLRL